MNIGDVWLALRADGARFQAEAVKEAQKAGDAAGATLGSRIGKAAGVVLRGGLTVLSGAAALATRGLLELESIQSTFQAETGATADEAKRAGQAINEMSGRNIQPMREIGAVLTKVHTDLGLTGAEAEATAEKFLQFARVTKQDAATEVAAFDDILDAWGLTAADSAGLMDQLIKSHQDYGGSIAEDEAALKNLAPAMKALNFDVDDTIGLLNLFKTKGLDAAATQRAFNSAVAKLPPGTNLQDVLEKIQAIEDPAERAAAAVEVFGSRGGVALANALAPGVGALEDYVITTEEAKGATDDAREAIDSTFGARAQLLIKAFGSKMIELGGSFGPVLTGLASLASLGGALGFGKLGPKISAGLAAAWKTALASSVVSGVISKGGSLAATLYLKSLILGDAVTGALSRGWAKVPGSAALGKVIAKAASAAASAYLAVLIVGDAIGTTLSSGWAKIAGTGSAATKAAGAAGRAAGLAFTLGLVLIVAKIAETIEPHITKAGQDLNIWKQLNIDAPDIHPEEWPWPLGPKNAPDWAGGAAAAAEGVAGITDAASSALYTGVESMRGGIAGELASGASLVTEGAETLVEGIPVGMEEAKDEAVAVARRTPMEIARALADATFHVEDAMTDIKSVVEDSMTEQAEMASIKAFLTGDAMAKGLASKKASVRAVWQAYKVEAEERLFALQNNVDDIAADTGQDYADVLKSKQGAVHDAAVAITGEVRDELRDLKRDAAGFAYKTGASYMEALASALSNSTNVKDAMYDLSRLFMAGSPPKDPENPLYGIDKWGYATGEQLPLNIAGAIQNGIGRVRDAFANVGRVLTQPMAMPEFAIAGRAALDRGVIPTTVLPQALAGAVTNQSGAVTNVTVQVPGLLRAETPTDVVRSLRHLNAYGTFGEGGR